MQFVSMREFTASPKETQRKLSASGELVITNNGTPTMLVVDIEGRDFIRLTDYLHRQEALDVLHSFQISSARAGKDILGMDEILGEIAEYRAERETAL